jgi:hypothetical protein
VDHLRNPEEHLQAVISSNHAMLAILGDRVDYLRAEVLALQRLVILANGMPSLVVSRTEHAARLLVLERRLDEQGQRFFKVAISFAVLMAAGISTVIWWLLTMGKFLPGKGP